MDNDKTKRGASREGIRAGQEGRKGKGLERKMIGKEGKRMKRKRNKGQKGKEQWRKRG